MKLEYNISKAVDRFIKADNKVYDVILRKSLRAGAKIVVEQGKRDIPQLSGQTVRALRVRAGKHNRRKRLIQFKALTQFGEDDAFYYSFTEFGTKRFKGKYYLRKATKKVEAQIIAMVTNEIRSGI